MSQLLLVSLFVLSFIYKICCCWDTSLLRLWLALWWAASDLSATFDTIATTSRESISQEEKHLETVYWHQLISTTATKHSWFGFESKRPQVMIIALWLCGLLGQRAVPPHTAPVMVRLSLCPQWPHHVGCFSFFICCIDVTVFPREDNLLLLLVSALTLRLLLAAP